MSFGSLPIRWLVLAAALTCAAGCARQSYVAYPLALPGDAQSEAARTLGAPQFHAYLRQHGVQSVPPSAWGLAELTLAGLFYRPELQAARARGRAARAQAQQAGQRPPLGVSPRIEHHSADGARDTPWSLGFELELPLASAARRAPLVQRAQAQAEAAELEVGALAWEVRSEVRARMLEMWSARRRAASLEEEAGLQQAVLAMLEKRRELGYASTGDVETARIRQADAQAGVAAANAEAQLALGRLAQATGVPLRHLSAASLSFAAFEELPDVPEAADARAEALRNRIDMRRGLLDFAAADAAVKLEVAQQYPTVTLRPGFLWDQGDRVWSLALDLILPPRLAQESAVRAASAQREAAAHQALAIQQAIMGEADTRVHAYQGARAAVLAADAATRVQDARAAQVDRQFAAGQVDRLERTLAMLESVLARRRADTARVEAQRAFGLLEDAAQVPASGAPLPAPPDAQAASAETAAMPPTAATSRTRRETEVAQ